MDVHPTNPVQPASNGGLACLRRGVLVAVIVIAAAMASIGGAVLMSGGAARSRPWYGPTALGPEP